MTQRSLYFIAAALFVIATAINAVNDGISLRTGIGLLLAALMAWLGMKAKDASASR